MSAQKVAIFTTSKPCHHGHIVFRVDGTLQPIKTWAFGALLWIETFKKYMAMLGTTFYWCTRVTSACQRHCRTGSMYLTIQLTHERECDEILPYSACQGSQPVGQVTLFGDTWSCWCAPLRLSHFWPWCTHPAQYSATEHCWRGFDLGPPAGGVCPLTLTKFPLRMSYLSS